MDGMIQHLIDGCLNGDKTSQLGLYNHYAKNLFNVCLRITGNSQDAEEAMQDAFLKAFASLRSFNGDSFEAWLKRIAVNSAIDTIRRQKEIWDELKDDYPSADESSEDDDEEYVKLEVESIKNAISLLASGYRTILSLYLFEGYDMEEIADILHVKPVTVRSQYLRGKKKLLDIIGKRNG